MEPEYLNTPEYTIELWDINGVFVADVSHLIATSLRITMPLNDVDEISFALDLVQFEQLCASINARPLNILEPYRTDVKIRRNDVYLVGAHVIETNVNFNNSDTNKLEVKCTGYLNHLKDRYLNAQYTNMTYAEIARQLITDTQAGYNLIKNGHFGEGLDGWQYWESGYIIWDSLIGYTAPGSLYVSVSTGPNTYGAARFNIALQAGLTYSISYRILPETNLGSTYIKAGGAAMNTTAVTDVANWTLITHTWTQASNASALDIYMNTSTNFRIDDVRLSDSVDSAANRDFGITLGVDEASADQQDDRVRNYDTQNVKDAIINLTKLEEDNFDFAFDANKVFNVWTRKGSDKAHIELVYPQNIKTVRAVRSGQNLANKVYALGAGIGNERIETSAIDEVSAITYRVRERVEMFNSVEEMTTLTENAVGVLQDRDALEDNIEVTVNNNALDLDLVELGDAIYVRIDGSTYVDYVNDLYRIVKLNINVSRDMDEDISLELEKWS